MWWAFCESAGIEVLFKSQIVPFRKTLLKRKIKQRFPKTYPIYLLNHKKKKKKDITNALPVCWQGWVDGETKAETNGKWGEDRRLPIHGTDPSHLLYPSPQYKQKVSLFFFTIGIKHYCSKVFEYCNQIRWSRNALIKMSWP